MTTAQASPEQLSTLSKGDLIALVVQLQAELTRLRAELAELQRPPPTSQNSSHPPSRDQKRNRPVSPKPKPRGARPGHARHTRPLVDNPDQVIVAAVARCACGADLRSVPVQAVQRRQLTELPVCKPIVLETRQHEVCCPRCGQTQRGVLPLGLEATRQFGPRLEALVVYLQHQQHLSYARTQQTLREVWGIELSEGGQACILERAGAVAQVQALAIRTQVRQSRVVKSDETGARVNGRTHWHWVFHGTQAIYHQLSPSRGAAVIQSVMGEACAEVWVSDCWSAQLKAPTQTHQLCLAHQIRNLQALRERCPRLRWARELQAVLREAIHLGKRREQLTPQGYQRRVSQLERRLAHLVARTVTTPAAQALVKRYRKHRAHLLLFLRDPRVPAHNNDCERSLRSVVVHRKVSGGFRSQWGAHAYADLASVIDTAKLRGQTVFPTLVALMGPPLPLGQTPTRE